MKTKIFVIYDPQEDFAERLAGFLSRGDLDYRFRAFTDRKRLFESLSEEPVQILLAEKPEHEEEQEKFSEMAAMCADHVIYFTHEKKNPEEGTVFKYQNCRELFCQVMAEVEHAGSGNLSVKAGDSVQRLAVFSPAGGCGKSMLVRQLCRSSLLNKPVLYLNMETFSSDDTSDNTGDMADCVYYFRQNRLTEEIWQRIRASEKDWDYLGPPLNPEDLDEISEEELQKLWNQLLSFGYKSIVVDVGSRFSGVRAAFGWCDSVIIPVSEKTEQKMGAFARYVKGTGKTEWNRKVLRFDLWPEDTEDSDKQLLLEEWGRQVKGHAGAGFKKPL